MVSFQANEIWRKSSRCGSSSCVEAVADAHSVHLRDGKNPTGPVLSFSHAAWRELIQEIKSGRPTSG